MKLGADARLESEIMKSYVPLVYDHIHRGRNDGSVCYSWNLDSIETSDHRAHLLRKPAHIMP